MYTNFRKIKYLIISNYFKLKYYLFHWYSTSRGGDQRYKNMENSHVPRSFHNYFFWIKQIFHFISEPTKEKSLLDLRNGGAHGLFGNTSTKLFKEATNFYNIQMHGNNFRHFSTYEICVKWSLHPASSNRTLRKQMISDCLDSIFFRFTWFISIRSSLQWWRDNDSDALWL